MKNKNVASLLLLGLSFMFMGLAIYFHNGYFDFVNNYIYPNATIPEAFKFDKLYFMNKKLALKNKTIYGLFLFSMILFFTNYKIQNKWLKTILFLQYLIVSIALLLWIVQPKGILY